MEHHTRLLSIKVPGPNNIYLNTASSLLITALHFMLFGPLPGIMFWRLLCKMRLRHRLSWDEKPEDKIQMELTAWSFVFVMCSCLHVLVVCLSTLLSAPIIWRKKRRFGQFKVLILVSVWRDWEKVQNLRYWYWYLCGGTGKNYQI
jgi:hypothetical protein